MQKKVEGKYIVMYVYALLLAGGVIMCVTSIVVSEGRAAVGT